MSDTPKERSTADRTIDTLAAVLLALAAVATAWSSYQASRWTGEQAKTFAAASAARVESTRASSLANTQTQIDVSVFTQWVDAALRDETELATFYQQRFRDEFKPAFRAWLRTDPFNDPSAPPSPFAMDEYRLAATQTGGRALRDRRGVGGGGPDLHPASDELRARRGAVRDGSVLRRDQHEAQQHQAPGGHPRRRMRRVRLGCLVDRDVPDQPVDLKDQPVGSLEPPSRPPIRARQRPVPR